MTARLELWLWIAARLTAFVLAFGVLVHLITVIYAVRGGLSAAEILARTQGNVAWLIFYVLFAWSVAVHAGIGTRTIVGEWTAWRGRSLDIACLVFALYLGVAGTRAALGLF